MRLDKFLANMGVGTRTEVKQLLKKERSQLILQSRSHLNLILTPQKIWFV